MLGDIELTDGRAVRTALHDIICRAMPTAAAASGFVSPVDAGPWVVRVSALFAPHDRPRDLGLTALTGWLAARGVVAGPAWVRAVRADWIRLRMQVETWEDNGRGAA